jgi:hypothetical protein
MRTPHHGMLSWRHGTAPLLRIIVGAFRKAMSLSVALKRPVQQLWGNRRFESFQLHGRVGTGVDLRRLHAGMAKPKGDLPQVFGGLEDCHRAGVPPMYPET